MRIAGNPILIKWILVANRSQMPQLFRRKNGLRMQAIERGRMPMVSLLLPYGGQTEKLLR